MLKDLLKEVIIIVAGKQAEDISDLLYSKKHVNEFIIAKKLDITINQTRNILYKISDHGLVSSIRKKDKRKGWYTYFWKIEIIKSLEFLKNILVKRIQQLDHQVKSRETKMFYTCENCNIEFNEENALLHNFTCNECGRIFTQKDNTKVLRDLKRQRDRLKKDLVVTNEEIEKEVAKEEKIKMKELAKEKKAKAEKRRRAAKKRAATKKLNQKLLKKKPKKKPAKRKKPVKRKKPAKKKKPKKKVVKKKPKKKKVVKKKTKKKTVKRKPKKKMLKKKPKKKLVKKKIKKKKKLIKRRKPVKKKKKRKK